MINYQGSFHGPNCDMDTGTADTCSAPNDADGWFNSPWGLVVSEDGTNLWVADYGNNRIQKFVLNFNKTVTDQVTIGDATAPPEVSDVGINPTEPVPAGQLEVIVSFNKSMTPWETPSVQVITQNNCPLTLYDEAVVLDDGDNLYDSTLDTLMMGVEPVPGTALVSFRSSTPPREGFIDYPIGGGGDGNWNFNDGEAIVRDGTTSENTTFNATADDVMYSTQTTPLGVPLDYDATAFANISGSYKHSDGGPNAGYYDGYYVGNEWRGWVTIPSGTTACCGGSCDGTAQVQVADGKDAAGTIQAPNPWNVNTATGAQFIIDTTAPTEPTITVPSDGTYTTLNSIEVQGSYNDANPDYVTVVATDFTCVVREDATSLNDVYNAGVDTLIYGTCADGDSLIPMTTKEGWIDNATGTANVYDEGEPIIGNYYDIDSNDPRYDESTDDRVLLDLGSYANLNQLNMFTTDDPNIKVNMVSSQTVNSDGTFIANNIGLPEFKDYYISAVGYDLAGNESPYVSKRVMVTRGTGSPGVAQINPSGSVGIETSGEWVVTYTSSAAFDYPADSGGCDFGADPPTTANCYIQVTLPSGWTAPTETSNTAGWTRVSTTGDTTLCAADNFSVSGSTIKVFIDKMNAGMDINVTYGYENTGLEVTSQAKLGGNTFVVKSYNNSTDATLYNVPPETGETLALNVEGRPLKVSHEAELPSVIYDNTTDIKIMTLDFENTNAVGSGKTDQVSTVKLKFIPSGGQDITETISRIVAKSGATEYLNTSNVSGITNGVTNIMTLTLSDPSSNPLNISPSTVKALDIYVDFVDVSTYYPLGDTLEFLVDGYTEQATGTISAGGISALTLTDTTQSWTTNEWVSYTLIPDLTDYMNSYIILSNTSDTLTIRSGDMSGDGAADGDTYAIGDARTYFSAKDQTSGTSLHVAPRTGSVTDTFYPDYPAADSEMSSGIATRFSSTPIANGLLVIKKDTWAVGQSVSKGHTSAKPFVLTFKLVDQIITNTDAGADCAPNCTVLTMSDATVFSGLEGEEVIIGDDDGSATQTIAVGGVDTIANTVTLDGAVGPFYKNKNMFILRKGASAKVSRVVLSFYECTTVSCTPSTLTNNPEALLDRVSLRQTGSNPAFYYVNKTDTFLENVGSTVTLDLSTYINLSEAAARSADLLLDIDPLTNARALKVGIVNATMVYTNNRKALTGACGSPCSTFNITNTVSTDLVLNERLFVTTDGTNGEWSTLTAETINSGTVTPDYTGPYTTDYFVEHTKILTGYQAGTAQSWPQNSLKADILNSAELEVVKMYFRTSTGTVLCPNTEAGTGTDNPEIYYGTPFDVVLEVRNTTTDPGSIAYVDTSTEDLSFVRLSDGVEYESEFSITEPPVVGGTCVHQACLDEQATGTITYTINQDGGTTVAPASSADYFKIDTNTGGLIGAPTCDTSKPGRYRPKTVDSNDYTDADVFCVNTDSNGVDNDPPDCRLSIKMAEAYILTDPVSIKYVGAGSTFVPVLNFTIHDGPTGNTGQEVTDIDIVSQNSTDTYILDVQLWRDNGDSTFNPYVANGTARQVLMDDCDGCTTIKVNDAARYDIGDDVVVCHDSACTTSTSLQVNGKDTTSSPNSITLNGAVGATIDQRNDAAYVYIADASACPTPATDCDTLVGTTTFSGGLAEYSGLTETIADGGYNRYWVSYNIDTALDNNGDYADGVAIDAAVDANSVVFTTAAPYDVSPVSPLPASDYGSSGQSKIDIVAVMVEADPPSSQSCVLGNRKITFKAFDIFANTDNGSYGNPVTYANANLTVTFTEGTADNTVDFISTSLSSPVYSPQPPPPPNDTNQIQGNLTSGIGTVTLTDTSPEAVTISAVSGLSFRPAGGPTTTFGDNVCINAETVSALEPPAGTPYVPIIKLQVINGLVADDITIDSITFKRSSLDTIPDSELKLIRLWYDADDDETCDICYPTLTAGDDVQLDSGTYTADSITFSGLGHVVPTTNREEYLYLTYDLENEVTDGRILDAEIPILGFTYSTGTVASLDDADVMNSPNVSEVNIDAYILEIYPYGSTATVQLPDCNGGTGANCLTINVDDVSIFRAGDTVSIQDSDSEIISPLLTIASTSPSGATSTVAGSITFTSPATGTFTVAENAFISNTPDVSKQVTVRAIDEYGNIASDAANTTFEASTEVSCTADNTQPDPSDTKVLVTGLIGGTNGLPSTTGQLTNGAGTATFIENSCPPRRVLIEPDTSVAGFTEFRDAIIRFPGDVNKDGTPPVVDNLTLNVTGTCVTSSMPEIDSISGTDDCSGVAGIRFACQESELDTAPWVTIEPAQTEFDVCCNCAGDPDDVGCGFDLVSGETCTAWDGTNCDSDGDLILNEAGDDWIANTGDPTGGCDWSAAKTVWAQFKDKNGNISDAASSTPEVIIDNVLPVIGAAGVRVYSDSEPYFYGTADAVSCDASPQQENLAGLDYDCKVFFNNLAGEGAGQIATVEIDATDDIGVKSLEGSAAFGLAAQWDILGTATSPAYFSVAYDNISVGDASSPVYFTVYDTCSNTTRIRVDFEKDNFDPLAPAAYGYATDGLDTALTSGNWYSYTNPHFTWDAATDQLTGVPFVDNSAVTNYKYVFSTNNPDIYANLIYATSGQSFTATGPLTTGNSYYVNISPHDNVSNYTSPASVFEYKFDSSAPDNPATPVNGWDDSGKATAISSGTAYIYTNPYFEWAEPADNPAAPASAGIGGYYVGFSTDANFDPVAYQAATSFSATASECGVPYYLKIKTRDLSSPPNEAATSVIGFTYARRGIITVTDNQGGDDTWRNATGTTYDVDYSISCGNLDKVEYTLCSAANMGSGTGTEVVAWTTFLGPGLGAGNYTTDWSIPFGNATDGINWVSVRAYDSLGYYETATDVFYILKDTQAPDMTGISVSGRDEPNPASNAILNNPFVWWNMETPYFYWDNIVDSPAAALNSGQGSYYVYFGTDASVDPAFSQGAVVSNTYYASSPVLADTPDTYYLVMKAEDNAGNISASYTAFVYNYDNEAPSAPADYTIYDTGPPAGTQIATQTWYSYPQPYYDWTASVDPYSGLDGYYIVMATDSTYFSTAAANFTSNNYYAVSASGPTLVSGYKYFHYMKTKDAVWWGGNISNLIVITNSEYWYDAEAPDNPATPVSGWASDSKAVGIADSGTYTYDNPYFEWGAPADNPAAPANAGLAGYYVGFSTDAASVPTYLQTAATYTATPYGCNQNHYLRIRAYDAAYPANVATTVTAFTYFWKGNPVITDNQTGDDTWRNATGTTYDVDFGARCGDIDYVQYALWSAADMGSGTGTELLTWTTFLGPAFGTDTYTTDWALSDAAWGSATDGINWVSVRVYTDDGLYETATDVFYIYKDTIEPPMPSVTAYDTNAMGATLTDNTWYGYANPYFDWAAVTDLPAVLNSGLSEYNIYFGTDSSGVPGIATASTEFESTATLVSGWDYYLRMSNEDNAGNATGTTTIFTYRYDPTPPDNPAVTAYDAFATTTTLVDSNWYNYANPYFEWGSASDLPVAPANSGFKEFNIYFGTDSSGVPSIATTSTAFESTDTLVSGWTYYLRMSSEDNAGNATGTTTVFTYRYDSTSPNNPAVTGYDAFATSTTLTSGTWYNYSNPYFEWGSASDLPAAPANSGFDQYNIYFGADSSGVPAIATTSTAFESTDTLVAGWTYYLRMSSTDNAGNATGATTVFEYLYDPTPPDNPPAVSAFDSFAVTTPLTSGNWYNYENPYFLWAAASDLPATPANSGFDQYNIYFGTNPAGTPDIATTTNVFESTATLVTGWTYYLRMNSTDNAGNATGTTTVASYLYDISNPDNPAAPVNGWASGTKLTVINDGGSYYYTSPYFEWAAPVDYPAAPANSGVYGYYVSFGTDPNEVPAVFQTAATYTATPVQCNADNYLRIRTRDSATPENATGAITSFTYYWMGELDIYDNQADDVWHNATGTTYDVDFDTNCGNLDYVEYTFWSAADMGAGTGTEILTWTTFLGPGMGTDTYTVDWAIADAEFAAATDGINFVSVRAYTSGGMVETATDVFYFRKDTMAPSILSGSLTESNNYMWISPADNKLYYGLDMAGAESFFATGTASDAHSGLQKMTFGAAFDDTPADDNTPATWSATYDIEASNTTASTITVTLYDNAGNTSTAEYYTVQDSDLIIQYATMTPPYLPTFVKFNVFYPDGVTEMTLEDPNGIYATQTAGADLSGFVKVKDKEAITLMSTTTQMMRPAQTFSSATFST